jgi:hypothetical protein
MFELSDESPRPWMVFVLHCGVVLFGVPILGLANYWITPLVGAGLATFRGGRHLHDEAIKR